MLSRSKTAVLLASVATFAVAAIALADEMAPDMSMLPEAGVEGQMAAAPQPVSGTGAPVAAAAPLPDATLMARYTAAASGLFSVNAPANTGIEVFVDGVLTIDATGTKMETVGTEITGLMSLAAGDHLIEVRGLAKDHPDLWRITIGPVGTPPVPLIDSVQFVDAATAQTILSARSLLTTASAAGADGAAAAPGFTPFLIGGGSSATGKSAPVAADAAAGAGGMATGAGGMMLVADRATGSAGGGMGGGSGGAASGGGSGGTGSGGSGGSGGGMGGGGGGGGTPTPTPTPTPNPTPVAPPPANMVQVSPLSPPANVVLTNAIQLTSAGGTTGRVANTGATLFGEVMDNTMFDIVRVAVSPSGRTTTVDVGPMTGQFAVRLFPEDFAAGPNVNVTITGASSASDQVASQPVSYALTGAPVQDGVVQALGRLTFGGTPDLYARVRTMGFAAFVEQQLAPETIPDAAFNAMNPDALLQRTTPDEGRMFRSIMAHDIAHAAFSEKQLREVMAQFWINHFYASTKDTGVRQQNITDRAFFRANAFGNFEDLLLYSARSPLMSQFLDNDQNRRNNINENYGREILELSSVGVNAGYTDNDVREVSRIFTGWNFRRTNPNVPDVAEEFEFEFRPNDHDTGNKTISFLNLTITGRTGPAGVQEGEELIAILAQNVNTRNFVCGKLVQLLVADEPPANFVASCAMAWETSGGEVEAMLRAILLDPAYISTVEFQRNKMKSPFELSVSTARLLGASPQADRVEDFYNQLREAFERAGQPILYYGIPTGLPEVASHWASSAVMIAAYNELMDITENRERYGIDLAADIQAAGIETAEEVAAYLLTVGTADRYRQDEFDALVAILKGDDGIFEPRVVNETLALERAMALLVVMPSFQLQ